MAKRTTAGRAAEAQTYARGIDRLRDEMARAHDPALSKIGEHLTEWVLRHPEDEARLLDPGRQLEGALDAIRTEAMRHKRGSVAVIDDAEGYRIAREYYGMTAKEDGGTAAAAGDSSGASRHLSQGGRLGAGDAAEAGDSLQRCAPPPAEREAFEDDAEEDLFDLDALMGGAGL